MSPRILFEGPQKSSIFFPDPEGSGIRSAFTPFRMQMASITSFTPDGGLFIVFTTVMSWRLYTSDIHHKVTILSIISSMKEKEEKNNKLLSRVSNLSRQTGSPVHQAPGQYSGRKPVFLFSPMYVLPVIVR